MVLLSALQDSSTNTLVYAKGRGEHYFRDFHRALPICPLCFVIQFRSTKVHHLRPTFQSFYWLYVFSPGTRLAIVAINKAQLHWNGSPHSGLWPWMEALLWSKRNGNEVSLNYTFFGVSIISNNKRRSLFLLHEHIQMLHATSSDIRWLQQCSLAGLGFVTQVMVDVAHDHLQRITPTNAGALPLSCAYNLQATIKHIKFKQIQKTADGCKAHNANLESLLSEMAQKLMIRTGPTISSVNAVI